VEVGAKLYELDTEGTATVEEASDNSSSGSSPAKEAPAASEAAPSKPAESAPPPTKSSPSHRSPSIHFLGKEGWQALKSGKKPGEAAVSKGPLGVTVVHVDNMPPMYGRPKFTEEEMEALIMGGASIAPSVVTHSKGAKFSY